MFSLLVMLLIGYGVFFFHLFQFSPLIQPGLALLRCCWAATGLFSKVLKLLPAALCWVLWRARNAMFFDGLLFPEHRLRILVMEQLQHFTTLKPILVPLAAASSFQVVPILKFRLWLHHF